VKRFVSTLLITSMLASVAPVWAQDREDRVPVRVQPLTVQVADASPPPAPAPTVAPPANITPLVKAQPAPYTGVLFSPEAIAKVIAQQDAQLQAQQLAVQNQAQVDQAQSKYAVSSLQTTCTEDENDLKAQLAASQAASAAYLKQLQSTSSGPGAGVWIGLGAVGGVVATLVIVFAVSKATN
jgi:hypothetical protein